MDETEPLLANREGHVEPDQYPDLSQVEAVGFDPAGDPANPLDWPKSYKWGIVSLLAFMSFTTTFTCVGIVPIASRIIQDLEGHKSKSASVLLVTIWELGEAAGPLLIAPLSEVYGRYPAYNCANVVFILGTIIVATSQTSGILIFARFMTGCAVAANVLSPSVIGDIFAPDQRGTALSYLFLANLVGGAIGPAIGGGIAQTFGWRQVVWMAVAIATACEIVFLCLLRETYSVRILQQRAEKISDIEDANTLVRTMTGTEVKNSTYAIWQAIKRPARVFYGSFVLQIMSLFGCVGFTFFYILTTTLPDILKTRFGFNEAQTGAAFLTFSVGSIIGILLCNVSVDRIYARMQKSHKGEAQAEFRLPLLIFGACTLPISVALYGWIAEERWPIGLMLFSIGFLGFALLVGVVPLMAYVVDAFGIYSASAMTAVLITRCLMGTFLPLATGAIVDKLGYGWAFTVLAGVCIAVAPIPMVVLKFGAKWRQLSMYSKTD